MLRLPPAWTLPLEKGNLERFQGKTEEIKERQKMTWLISSGGAASLASAGGNDGHRWDPAGRRGWGHWQPGATWSRLSFQGDEREGKGKEKKGSEGKGKGREGKGSEEEGEEKGREGKRKRREGKENKLSHSQDTKLVFGLRNTGGCMGWE